MDDYSYQCSPTGASECEIGIWDMKLYDSNPNCTTTSGTPVGTVSATYVTFEGCFTSIYGVSFELQP